MIYHQQESLRHALDSFHQKNQSIGFVPTMGALHEGHLSLVEKALSENTVVVVSIFVNPTQFDNASDLEKYPRTLEADAKLLRTLKGTILVYAPSVEDLYGNNVVSKNYNFGGLEHAMEGKYRTGHFDGVGTVLNLLFRAVRPTKAYFGEKDFQQLQIVRRLVAIEKLPVQIVGCAILRESHGLAMSSRNQRLSKIQFEKAALIYHTLKRCSNRSINKVLLAFKTWPNRRFVKVRIWIWNTSKSQIPKASRRHNAKEKATNTALLWRPTQVKFDSSTIWSFLKYSYSPKII